MNNKLRTAWTVAAVLGILLVIMTVMWGNERGLFTLDSRDLEEQREKIAEACGSADELDTPACRDALADLSKLLARFERQLERDQEKEADVEGGATSTVELVP